MLPIADRHNDYAATVCRELQDAGLRVDLDDRSERVNAKIRDAQLQKIPYMLVIGDREAEARSAAVRLRSGENLGGCPGEIIERITRENRDRSWRCWPLAGQGPRPLNGCILAPCGKRE